MSDESELRNTIARRLEGSVEEKIAYNYFDGKLNIGTDVYDIGQKSFSEVAHAVLDALSELYGGYRVIPYTFNSEAYENDNFKAEVLALGGLGLLEFSVCRKRVVV